MHLELISAAVVLFASMFIPLPSPAGLAIALWALATGVPLPAVIGLYVLQDVLSFTAIRTLLPRLSQRYAEGWTRLHGRL
ncbi:MAG TPA: hypothetical protein VFA70_10390, partial [Dehalococcoidia bacterium]|nr:hypothetical protein [Dehalococcoidia bacterium]